MIIVCTGPREWTDYEVIFNTIQFVQPPITLVEGEAEGFDKLCRKAALALGWDIKPMPVETWYPNGKYDPQAGHKRNQAMIDWALSAGERVAGLAGIMDCTKPKCRIKEKHNTHGTADCMRRMVKAGLDIVEVYPNG